MNNLSWSVKAKLYQTVRNRFPFHFIIAGENSRFKQLIQSIDLNAKRVIDLATGTGNALQFLTEAKSLIGVDLVSRMLLATRKIYADANLIQADALNVPVKANSIDVITAIGLSEYIDDIDLLFNEFVRLLKRGSFLIITFSPRGLWTCLRLLLGHHIYPRNLDEIIKIAKKTRLRLVKSSRSFMQQQALFRKE